MAIKSKPKSRSLADCSLGLYSAPPVKTNSASVDVDGSLSEGTFSQNLLLGCPNYLLAFICPGQSTLGSHFIADHIGVSWDHATKCLMTTNWFSFSVLTHDAMLTKAWADTTFWKGTVSYWFLSPSPFTLLQHHGATQERDTHLVETQLTHVNPPRPRSRPNAPSPGSGRAVIPLLCAVTVTACFSEMHLSVEEVSLQPQHSRGLLSWLWRLLLLQNMGLPYVCLLWRQDDHMWHKVLSKAYPILLGKHPRTFCHVFIFLFFFFMIFVVIFITISVLLLVITVIIISVMDWKR